MAALWWPWAAGTFFAAIVSRGWASAQFAAQLFWQSKGCSSHDCMIFMTSFSQFITYSSDFKKNFKNSNKISNFQTLIESFDLLIFE